MKKFIPVLLTVLIMLMLPVSIFAEGTEEKDPGTYNTAANGYAYTAPTVSDNSKRIYDFDDLLTDEEEQKLTSEIQSVENGRKCTVVVVTTENTALDPNFGTDVTRAYAEDFYDANASGFQDDAWVMCVDMHNRVIYTVGHGRFAKERYVNFTNKVYDDVRSSLSDGDYVSAVKTYIQDVNKLDNWVYAMIPTLFSLFVSAAVTILVLVILIVKHKHAEPINNAKIDVKVLNSKQVKHSTVFLGRHTTSRRIPHDDGGSGGGFSGGMSTSGGGSSFSGGGGHF